MKEPRPSEDPHPEPNGSPRVSKVQALIERLATTSDDDVRIARLLIRRLESHHDRMVQRLCADGAAQHSQIAAWAVDADRLMLARNLLEAVALDNEEEIAQG